MKTCPKCHNKVSNLQEYCPICGARVDGRENYEDKECSSAAFFSGKAKDSAKNVLSDDFSLTRWNIVFLIVLNLCVILVALNIFNVFDVKGVWCRFPIAIMLFVYFIAFAFFSARCNQFVTRLRNAVWFTLFVLLFLSYIDYAVTGAFDYSVYEYIMTSSIIFFDLVMLSLFFLRKIAMFNAFVSELTMTPYCIALIVYAIIGLIGSSKTSLAFIVTCCVLTFCTQLNFACFYVFKFKDKTDRIFKFWE